MSIIYNRVVAADEHGNLPPKVKALLKGDEGKPGHWTKDAQAKAQGYWIVVSPTQPESGTYRTADGTVVPVVWQKPIEVMVPVIPEAPYFDKYALSIQVASLVGVDYYLTGFTKDGATVDVPDVKIPDGGILKLADVSGKPALPYTVNMEARAEPGYKLPSAFTWAYSVVDPNEVTVVTSDAFTGALSGSIWDRTSDAALGGTPKFWGEHKFSQGATGTEVMTLADEKLRIDPTKGRQVASFRDIGMNQRVEFDISFSEDAANPYFNIILASPGGKQAVHMFGGEASVSVRGGSAGKNFDVSARVGSTSAAVGKIPGGGKFAIELLENSLNVMAPGIAPVTISVTRGLDPVKTTVVFECYPEHGGQKGLYYLDNIKVSRIGF